MNEVINYNELFNKLQKDCDAKNCCNAFKYITLDDLIDLNHLLDRVIIFCENTTEEELDQYECGHEIYKLYDLADTLFTRDLD